MMEGSIKGHSHESDKFKRINEQWGSYSGPKNSKDETRRVFYYLRKFFKREEVEIENH